MVTLSSDCIEYFIIILGEITTATMQQSPISQYSKNDRVNAEPLATEYLPPLEAAQSNVNTNAAR